MIRAKDLSGVLSVYAPDIVRRPGPPKQYVGIAAYRRPWEETFASFEGPIGYEVSDLYTSPRPTMLRSVTASTR